MAKKQDLLEKKLKACIKNISSVSNDNNNNNLGSYLAGLFEASTLIWNLNLLFSL